MATSLHVVTGEQYRVISRRMRDIQRQLDQDGGSPLDPERVARDLQYIVEGRSGQTREELLTEQERFCREVGLTVDLNKVRVSMPSRGHERLIVVPQGMTISRALEVCRGNFSVYCYWDDPDKQIIKNDRSPDQAAYAIWGRSRIEADEELKNRSANQLRNDKVLTMTLLERLIYELKYFKETSQHLDIQNWTLCAGSRDHGGDVPCVYWDDGELRVRWCLPDHAGPRLRGRSVSS